MRLLLPIFLLVPLAAQVPLLSPGYEPNRGELPSDIRFVRRSSGSAYYLTRDGVQYRPGFGVQIVNVPANAEPVGETASAVPLNLYRGSDPAGWRNGRAFETVRLPDIGHGASAVFSVVTNALDAPPGFQAPVIRSQRISIDFPAGADLGRFRFRVLHDGNMLLNGPGGVWFTGGSIPGVFVLSATASQGSNRLEVRVEPGPDGLGISVPGRDPGRGTRLDLDFPNYEFVVPRALPEVRGAGGDRFVFDIQPGAALGPDSDILLSRLDSQGRPRWFTRFGGALAESAGLLQISGDLVILAGASESADLPLTTGARARSTSRSDVFLAAFDASTGALRQATFAGLAAFLTPTTLAVNRAGDVAAGGQNEDRRGYLLRWQPSANRLAFVTALEEAVRDIAWESDEVLWLVGVPPLASGFTLRGYDASGRPASPPLEVPAAGPVDLVRLLPATSASYYALYSARQGDTYSTWLARLVPRDQGIVFHRRLAREAAVDRSAVGPDGTLRVLMTTGVPDEPASANAPLAASCGGSSYYTAVALDGSLRFATYVVNAQAFDLAAQNDAPPAPAPRLTCAASTAGRQMISFGRPGQLVTLTGGGFGPAAAIYSTVDSSGRYPEILAGYRVRANGSPVPLIAVARGLVAVQLPFDRFDQVALELTGPDLAAGVGLDLRMSPGLQPALFESGVRVNNLGLLAALNEDGTVNSAANPAAPGSVVSVFGTGLGNYHPIQFTGELNPPAAAPVTGLVSGCAPDCSVLYLGAAPGLSTGIFQVNLRVAPRSAPPASVFGFDFAAATAFRNLFVMAPRHGVWVR